MVKQAPTFGRLLTMVVFALSCFGLLLFLWLSFGGSTPLQPKGYRIKVAVPEAAQLGLYADVRVAGVSIGKVREKTLDDRGNLTVATLELDRRFAPLHADAHAILRQKTLLGETYLELTPGTKASPTIREGGWLKDTQVAKTTQLDEILDALDPKTRTALQVWQQSLAQASRGRGRDVSDAFGNLPGFAESATSVLDLLSSQSEAVRRLVRNTGVVFNALTADDGRLRDLVVSSGKVFDATASQDKALAETISIFPTFLDESKATFARLNRFSRDTDPLVRDLRPVARDLRPTLRDVRAFAPDLRRFLVQLDPLITASKAGLPALRDTFKGLKPLLAQVDPFLSQLNPILRWLEFNQHATSDFIANGGGALSDTVKPTTSDEIGHYLRQFGPGGVESVAMAPTRNAANRGNAYPGPTDLQGPARSQHNIIPSYDCINSGGPYTTQGLDELGRDDPKGPDCYTKPLPGGPFPKVGPISYAKPAG